MVQTRSMLLLVSAAIVQFALIQASLPDLEHGINLATTRPLIIAHRGASGELPEHTVAAYQRAVDQGADVIECDVCVTKDLRLVCLHEPALSETTNVEEVYPPDRMRTLQLPGASQPITEYFSFDFTLEELKRLRVNQRSSFRDPNYNGLYPIASLDECIMVAQNAPRVVGIYPETKLPTLVNSLNITREANTSMEDLLVEVLAGHRYSGKQDPCFIQSFSEGSIRALSSKTQLPLIYLHNIPMGNDRLNELATFCYGIGPTKSLVLGPNGNGSALVDRAHAVGLRVHPYTARNEDRYLDWHYGQDYVDELEVFFNVSVDGLFTDFPKSYKRFLDVKYACSGDKTASNANQRMMVADQLMVPLIMLLCTRGIFPLLYY